VLTRTEMGLFRATAHPLTWMIFLMFFGRRGHLSPVLLWHFLFQITGAIARAPMSAGCEMSASFSSATRRTVTSRLRTGFNGPNLCKCPECWLWWYAGYLDDLERIACSNDYKISGVARTAAVVRLRDVIERVPMWHLFFRMRCVMDLWCVHSVGEARGSGGGGGGGGFDDAAEDDFEDLLSERMTALSCHLASGIMQSELEDGTMAPGLCRGPRTMKAQSEPGFYVGSERRALRVKEERRLWDITAARWPGDQPIVIPYDRVITRCFLPTRRQFRRAFRPARDSSSSTGRQRSS
jgi:hypothetical protein